MKTNAHNNNDLGSRPIPPLRVLSEEESADLDSLGEPEIDWVTIGGFLRALPREKPWGINSSTRFGKAANQVADAFGMVYQTAFDPVLGNVRVFPRPLLVRVYKEMWMALGWPRLTAEAAAPAERAAIEPKVPASAPNARDRELADAMLAQLRMLAKASTDGEVRLAATTMLEKLQVPVTIEVAASAAE